MGDHVEQVGEAIDGIPVGRFHWRLMIFIGAVWAAMGIATLSISFVLPAFIDEWNLSGTAAGVLGSASLVGMLIGNSVGGWYADRAGRQQTLAVTVVLFSLFTGLTALSIDLYTASLFRFLTGLGMGGALVAGASYITEHLPTARRGRYVTYLETFYSVGSLLTVATAWAVLSALPVDGRLFGVEPWRIFFAVGIVPILLGVAIYMYLPESPYFLAHDGRTEAAISRINSIAKTNNVPSPKIGETLSVTRSESDGFGRLFEKELGRTTVMMAGLWFAVNLAYYAVFTWLPTTVAAAGYVENLYQYLSIVAVFQLLGQLSSAYLIEKIGRKWTLSFLLTLGAGSTSLFATALPGVEINIGLSGSAAFSIGIFSMAFALFGAWAVLYAYTSEVFPTEVRSTGLGFSGSVGKVAAVSGPILFGSLVSVGYLAALIPVAIVLCIAAMGLLAFGDETKGQTLI